MCVAWSAGWNCACCAQPIDGRACGLGRYWPFGCLSVYLYGLFGKDRYSILLATSCKVRRAEYERGQHTEIEQNAGQQNPAEPNYAYYGPSTQGQPIKCLPGKPQHRRHSDQGG